MAACASAALPNTAARRAVARSCASIDAIRLSSVSADSIGNEAASVSRLLPRHAILDACATFFVADHLAPLDLRQPTAVNNQ
jgi:hypothetical protein